MLQDWRCGRAQQHVAAGENTPSFSTLCSLHLDPSQTFMYSFDVVSLFTNIPVLETLQICPDALCLTWI